MTKEDFDIKTEYETLKKKYQNLPSFETINNEFELKSIDKNILVTRQIRRRLADKIIFFCRIIENIIYPSMQSTISAYETSFFSDEEKIKLVSLHKRLMIFERQSLALDVETTEEKDINFILGLFEEWQGLKNEVKLITQKTEEAWKKELKEESQKYFG